LAALDDSLYVTACEDRPVHQVHEARKGCLDAKELLERACKDLKASLELLAVREEMATKESRVNPAYLDLRDPMETVRTALCLELPLAIDNNNKPA